MLLIGAGAVGGLGFCGARFWSAQRTAGPPAGPPGGRYSSGASALAVASGVNLTASTAARASGAEKSEGEGDDDSGGGADDDAEARRRLAHSLTDTSRAYPTYISWFTGESTITSNGVVPVTTCPPGRYRHVLTSNTDLKRGSGQRIEGCKACPPGRFGTTSGLTSALCTGYCPAGRYRRQPGGVTAEDCTFCPEGTYGDKLGLTTPQCTANCPDGEYSDVAGLDDKNDCKDCPPGYRGWQCTWELKPLNYDGVKEHAFDKDAYSIANAQHPQGRSPVSFYTLDLGTQGPQHLPLVNCAGDDDVVEKDERCTG